MLYDDFFALPIGAKVIIATTPNLHGEVTATNPDQKVLVIMWSDVRTYAKRMRTYSRDVEIAAIAVTETTVQDARAVLVARNTPGMTP